jgi:hypothetical protein
VPAISGQTINADGCTLTSKFGTFQVVIVNNGGTIAISLKKDGAPAFTTAIPNGTAAQVESTINTAVNTQMLNGGSVNLMYAAVHIFSLSPVKLTVISSNTPIPANWWLLPNG